MWCPLAVKACLCSRGSRRFAPGIPEPKRWAQFGCANRTASIPSPSRGTWFDYSRLSVSRGCQCPTMMPTHPLKGIAAFIGRHSSWLCLGSDHPALAALPPDSHTDCRRNISARCTFPRQVRARYVVDSALPARRPIATLRPSGLSSGLGFNLLCPALSWPTR